MLRSASVAAIIAMTLTPFATVANAADKIKLPDQITVVTYDVGSMGYTVTLGLTKPFKENIGTNLRIIPGKNDVARISLLKKKTATYAALGSDGVYVQEGMHSFGKPRFGPTPVRMISMNINKGSSAFIVTKESGIKSLSELRGKRITQIKGSAVSYFFTAAYLAYAGLTWDDVTPVPVAGFSDAGKALMDGRADGSVSNTNSSIGRQLDASPRGARYLPFPHDDAEAWKRMNSVVPWLYKHVARTGVTVPPEGIEMATAPYPILVTLADTSDQEAYNMSKAIYDLYPQYKDSVRGVEGWGLDSQRLEATFIPYHDGAIRYFKEKGIWTAGAEAKQKANVARQNLLAETWAKYAANAPSDEEAFVKGWQTARAAALTKAGLVLVQKDW